MIHYQGKFKKLVLLAAIIVALGSSSVQMVNASNPGDISIDNYGLSYSYGGESKVTLSIVGPSSSITNIFSSTGDINWQIPSDSLNGLYRYELVSVTQGVSDKEEDMVTARLNGSFEIYNGVISESSTSELDDGGERIDEHSSIGKPLIEKFAISVVNFFVPSADAASLSTAPDGDLDLEDDSPGLYFTRDPDTATNAPYSSAQWALFVDHSTGIAEDDFIIQDDTMDRNVLILRDGTPYRQWFGEVYYDLQNMDAGNASILKIDKTNSIGTMIVNSDGDIGLAGDSVFIDKSSNRVGIGTTTPEEQLQIVGGAPAISLYDTNGIVDWRLNDDASGARFDITAENIGSGTPTERLLMIEYNAKPDSLQLLDTGVNIGGDGTANAVKLGIGTETPEFDIEVLRRYTARMAITGITSPPSKPPVFLMRRARNDGSGNPLALNSGDYIGQVGFRGHTGSDWSFNQVAFAAITTEAWSPSAMGSKLEIQTTPNGTTSPVWALRAESNGDVKVRGNLFVSGAQMAVPDYVFEDDYQLMPLEKLANFVDKEKHLPKIASASDVKENGINISQTQLNLLEKIEELTLYAIAQHRQIKEIEKESANMKTKYEQRLAGLEKLVRNLASSDSSSLLGSEKIALK